MQKVPVLSAALSTGSSVTDVLRNTVFSEFSASVTVSVSAPTLKIRSVQCAPTSVSVFPVIALKPHIPSVTIVVPF